ncbi:MAG: hypothetical protein GC155_06770 [Alphaproteobacteria bacterium]|nr:hypothetical protein [Alphaproteobacteria bacterium]
MKAFALINPAAGGVPADGEMRIRHALDEAGLPGAAIEVLDPENGQAQIREIAGYEPDVFIVWGGDGTLRSALSIVGRKTPNLLLLPGGTMNLLTKSIHGDHPWNQILSAVIESPRVRNLPAGELNGDLFYCAMLAGAPARFAEARESLRRGEIGSVVAGARAALDTLQTLHLNARYSTGRYATGDRLPPTSVIGALVGPLVKEHQMEVASLSDASTAVALNVIWTSFLSDWRSAPGVTVVPAETLVIESDEGDEIPVILDGEAVEAGDRVRITYKEEAAQCLTAA